jgi:hypothetical protein
MIVKQYQLFMTRRTYLFGLLLIVLFPVIIKLHLILFGEKVQGEVCYYRTLYQREGNISYPIVKFKALNNNDYEAVGLSNTFYPTGTKFPVCYAKSNPERNTIFTFEVIYLGNNVVIPIIALMVWSALYLALRKPKVDDNLGSEFAIGKDIV